MTDWKSDAEALFGSEWVNKLARIAGASARSVREHWIATQDPPPSIVLWLRERVSLLPEPARRPYGSILLTISSWPDPWDSHRRLAVETALALALRDISEGRLP